MRLQSEPDLVRRCTVAAVQLHDRTPRRVSWTAIGAAVAGIGFPASGVLFLLSVFSANACGMFGDGCEDYGKPAAEFPFLAVGAVLLLGVAFAGLIVAIVSAARRRRRAE